MAPSRRKGASRATAAAAARRFKVGDLVLAKVKGFSAWPAMVSEPEKWGFPADPKKVHVFFFGTQQIAFCSPTDVEFFTEEKKESYLNKCHGKSSDFVRAVQEIIDSYEKLKKKDLVNDVNSSEEVTLTNGRNFVKSPTTHDLKKTIETPAASPDAQLNASTSPADKYEPHLQAFNTTLVDCVNGEEGSTEEPADSVVAKVIPSIAAHSSRKRSSGSRLKRLVAQGVATSTDRSRSSCRLESQRHQRKLTNNSDVTSMDMVSNSNQDGLRRSSRRSKKSTVTFEGDDVQSLSYGSTEDNGSEIAAINSDSSSLSGHKKIGADCEPEQSDTLVCFGGDVGLSKGLDLQINGIVHKKKRKPSRKRVTSSAAVPAVKYEKVEDLEVGSQDLKAPVSPCMKWDGGDSREDGDEHLPLSKRARVRMGKQFSSEEGFYSSTQIERKTEEVEKGQKQSATHSDGNCLAEECSPVLERTSDDSSKEATDLSNNMAQCWQVKNNQLSSCSLEGEAALPPSKRLHRALEAMSANASEEDRFFPEASLILKTKVTECSTMSMQQIPHRATEGEYGNGSGLNNEKSLCNNVSQVGVTESSPGQGCILSQENTKFSMEVTIGNQLDNDLRKKNEVLVDKPRDGMDVIDGRALSEPSSGISKAEAAAHSARHLSPSFNGDASNCCNLDSTEKKQSLKEAQPEIKALGDSGCEHGNKEHGKEHNVSGESGLSPISVTSLEKVGEGPARSVTTVSCNRAEATICEKSESLKSQVNENRQVNGMCDMKGNKVNEGQEAIINLNFSNDRTVEKENNGAHLSLAPSGGLDSPVQISPRSASLYHISTSESVADDVKVDSSPSQRPKSLGKSNYVEAQAALASFESLLGSLTRTKESIGRATRIAMDCAKFGTAAKVIEILTYHLENEQSLHRRVDLFFLVDSIAQCSRSLKGSVCGAYSSAIQIALPRLLSATAPPGSEAQENRRQCLKVLRLWSARRILPESSVRHHMRELDSVGGLTAVYTRRSLRTERALDDPVRDMGSMLVDEYGSNSSFQLPGLCMPCMRKDEDDDSDSDGESFEAVTPEHRFEIPEGEDIMHLNGKRGHILEDVDGELEMEDVAPYCEAELNSTSDSAQFQAVHTWESHPAQSLPQHSSSDSAQFQAVHTWESHPVQSLPQHFTHPLPAEVASSSPQVPPLPPPLPPSESAATAQHTSASTVTDCCPDGVDYKPAAPSHNMQGSYRQSASQNSVSRHNHSFSNSGHYHSPEHNRESHRQMQLLESSSSYNDFHSRPGNNSERGVTFHNNVQPRPRPVNSPSSQFSDVHTEQHVKSRRETPRHSYSNRSHNGHMNRGNYYNNHERIKPGYYDHRGGWRAPAPSFPSGPMGIMNDGWNMAPRPWDHRNPAPFRPHPESSFPVSSRGPGFWRPR